MFSIDIFKKYCSTDWLPVFEFNKQTIKIKAKSRVFNQCEDVKGIYFIEKGKVKVLSKSNDGEEKIIRLATDGMILGHRALNTKCYPISAEALTDLTLTFLPRSTFINLIKANPELSIYLINFMSDELLDSEERMKNLQILDPKIRIAIILLKSIDVFGFDKKEKTKLSFTLSRYDIANLAGTTYETVIRTLAYFSKENLITLEGKEICINKEKELRKLAGQTEEKVTNESDKSKPSRKKTK